MYPQVFFAILLWCIPTVLKSIAIQVFDKSPAWNYASLLAPPQTVLGISDGGNHHPDLTFFQESLLGFIQTADIIIDYQNIIKNATLSAIDTVVHSSITPIAEYGIKTVEKIAYDYYIRMGVAIGVMIITSIIVWEVGYFSLMNIKRRF